MALSNSPIEATERPPGPKGLPLIGVVPQVRGDVLGFFVRMMHEYGDVVALDFGLATFFLVCHPDGVQHVLQGNNRNYRKGYDVTKPLIGEGLVSSEGDYWLRQRRLMQPAFHRREIEGFAQTMVATTLEIMEDWPSRAASGEAFDVSREMTRLTQQIIARTMFSTDVGDQTERLMEAFDVGLAYLNQHMFNPIPFIDRLPTPTNIRFRRALATLDETTYDLIAARRAARDRPGDLLTTLIEAADEETGATMTDRQLRDEVITTFFAGHETTASALSWTWHLLSQHPEVARKVFEEVDSALGDRPPGIGDLPALGFCRQVIDESLRLYPPAWMFARRSIDEDVLCGYTIPAGVPVLLSPYTTHRHPDFWEDPEVFDPDRFAPSRAEGRHRMAYFPFGGGPRLCIGKDFALVEATLILAAIAQRYRLESVPEREVKTEPIATLRPRPGVWVTAHDRR